MSNVPIVLGGQQFDHNCDEIDVRWSEVSGAEVVLLGQRMAAGECGSRECENIESCTLKWALRLSFVFACDSNMRSTVKQQTGHQWGALVGGGAEIKYKCAGAVSCDSAARLSHESLILFRFRY
jgi:hypothetical protein